jgi:hypothetical protein
MGCWQPPQKNFSVVSDMHWRSAETRKPPSEQFIIPAANGNGKNIREFRQD